MRKRFDFRVIFPRIDDPPCPHSALFIPSL
jgi:hypothetical protein